MLDSTFVIKNSELCLIGSDTIRGGMREAGLFLRDTRFLSAFELRIDGQRCDILDVRSVSDAEIVRNLANPTLPTGDVALRPHSLGIRQRLRVGAALEVDLEVTSYTLEPLEVNLDILLGADFQDMFMVRGFPGPRPAVPMEPVVIGAGHVRLASDDDAELEVATVPAPDRTEGAIRDVDARPGASPEATASLTYALAIVPQQTVTLHLSLMPRMAGAAPVSGFGPDAGFEARSDEPAGAATFDAFIDRCHRDLAMLFTSFPDGPITAAGIPWFIAPFGRDSLIVAMQTLHAYPERSAATLRTLAALQGANEDLFREEEPGKILHEVRYGHLARTRQIPHTPYYGSIDATPLFVMAFAEHMRWRPDDPVYDELLPNVRRALDWIERSRQASGDGLLRYGGVARDFSHISQQGWKDSGDSLHFADGRDVAGPIALVEVQGYVYAAAAWLADAVEARGDHAWARELRAVAEDVRAGVEDRFWLEEAGFYAQALDGEGMAVDAISSNPGHLLFCGLPSDERARLVADRLGAADMLCPWGIRTLSAAMATYNPMSYHNGSTWPHDSSLAMAGLMRYGHEDLARGIAGRLVAASRFDPDARLDELYCGFADAPEAGPVSYPVSCRPQAWAAGAGLLAQRTLAGIEPSALSQTPSR